MPEGIYLSVIQAARGEVWIPSLSVLVSRMQTPITLRRRVGTDPELGLFDLHAAVSYFNAALWEDDDFTKSITLWVGKRPLKVVRRDTSTVLSVPGHLRIEGVDIEWLHE